MCLKYKTKCLLFVLSRYLIDSSKEGLGKLTSQSGILGATQYGFTSRFAEGINANSPEIYQAILGELATFDILFSKKTIEL